MKYNFRFVVEGVSLNKGEFFELGEGTVVADMNDFENEACLHQKMINGALNTFIKVTQPAQDYQSISELKVTLNEINAVES